MEIIVRWQVEDNYCGKSRPQRTKVNPLDEFDEEEWEEMSMRAKEEYIEECVQEDFDQKISFAIDEYGIE